MDDICDECRSEKRMLVVDKEQYFQISNPITSSGMLFTDPLILDKLEDKVKFEQDKLKKLEALGQLEKMERLLSEYILLRDKILLSDKMTAAAIEDIGSNDTRIGENEILVTGRKFRKPE